ncbi:hypothetical protein ACFPM3_21750 [Streptomyces coeruleoprunus]|uniref:C2H2-type domain-containing protein n=1 Tax=Streptomyces coeruleoprunus TaxID=285563 RepID=A0ABV9XJ69_9ACTN
MSETTDIPVGHEAYAFACMKCGYAWEQAYEIEHHTDITGHDFIVYRSEGRRVPSPLSRPTCLNCGGHVVRIMRQGQVSSVLGPMEPGALGEGRRAAVPVSTTGPLGQIIEEHPHPEAEQPAQRHRRPLSGLFRSTHRK